MGNVYAVRAAFIYSWKMTTGGGRFLSFLGTLIFVVALGWFAHESGDPAVVTYLAIGAYMMVVWNFCVSRMGWSLRGELVQGTLELMLMSRTPIMTILAGSILAVSVFASLLGVTGIAIVLAFSPQFIHVPNLLILLVSLGIALAATTVVGFLSAPLSFLTGGQDTYFEAIRPLVMVFSGFVYPVASLAPVLKPVAWLLPTSWAMGGLLSSVEGGQFYGNTVDHWALALATSAAYLGLTYLLFINVEKRVKATGILGSF